MRVYDRLCEGCFKNHLASSSSPSVACFLPGDRDNLFYLDNERGVKAVHFLLPRSLRCIYWLARVTDD